MKKVLVSAYFFMGGSSMGDIRVRRALRNLHRHGYKPVIVTHDRNRDQWPASDDYELVPVRGLDLAKAYRRLRGREGSFAPAPAAGPKDLVSMRTGFSTWIKQWLLVPDPQMLWGPAALRAAREVLRRERVDAVYASLAPRTDMRVATRVAAEFGLPCVVEYRDLWTSNFYDNLKAPTPLHRWLHARMERTAIRRATRITCVSTGLADYLRARYADLRPEISVDYGFFDPAEYPPRPPREPGRPLTVSYVGKFYFSRQPGVFLEGLRRFVERTGIRPGQFRFQWLGEIIGVDRLRETVEAMGLGPFVEYYGHVPHRQAIETLTRSDVALIVQAPQDTIHIPGKIYEAMGARTPILYISPPFEGTEIVERTGAGLCCPHDAEAVGETLARFRAHREQGGPWPFREDEVRRFDKDVFLARLAVLFDQAIADHATLPA
ncbi:MAG TPA: glycosyltransferase [Kiritimatiellia bacterium]|nr:glycosyltransferase [Kiritimatiellia bacterium]HRZ12569.1 glycosyltransferase [Kiritimatiellia bacterium]HSA17647.1 glycosyltransferase [Kiritimatiellia bacterium]